MYDIVNFVDRMCDIKMYFDEQTNKFFWDTPCEQLLAITQAFEVRLAMLSLLNLGYATQSQSVCLVHFVKLQIQRINIL